MRNLDSLKQILLNMNYDSKATFSENKKILEQNLILEFEIGKYCLKTDYELEIPGFNRTLKSGTCFEPKSNPGHNAWAVALNSGNSNVNFPYVLDCSEKHGVILFSNKEGNITDMYTKGPNFTSGKILKFVEEQNDETTKLINDLIKYFCVPFNKQGRGDEDKILDVTPINGLPAYLKRPEGQENFEENKEKSKNFFKNYTCVTEYPGVESKALFNGFLVYEISKDGSYYRFSMGENDNKLHRCKFSGQERWDDKTCIGDVVTDCNDEVFKKTSSVGTGSKPPSTQTKTQTKPKTQTKTQTKTQVEYIDCNGTYSYGCKSPKIEEAQKCLKDQGLYTKTVDGKFGGNTLKAVKSKINKTYFTDADIANICGRKQEERKSDPGSTPGGGSKREEEYVWNGSEI
jgi:hypothetical protein